MRMRLLPSAGAIMFTNKNELQINLNNNNQVYAQYADKILFNTDEMAYVKD